MNFKSNLSQSQIDMFMAMNGKKFNYYQLQQISNILPQLDESRFQFLLATDFKDTTTMLIISLLGGSLGIDRFLLGDTALGIVKLFTCGGFGIWTIIDWFLIREKTQDYNFRLFLQVANQQY